MSDVFKVASRIRKLLALANSSNMNEASAAAAQAQRLMQEHKLSEADVEAEDGSTIAELPVGSEGFMASWKFALVTGVARSFFCEAIALRRGQRRRVRVIGRRDDAEVAVGVFKYLVSEIEKLSELDADSHEAKVVMSSGGITARTYRDRYRQGAAAGVVAKLKGQTSSFVESSEKALTVVTKSKEELRDYLKSRYGESKRPTQEVPKGDAAEEAFLRGYDRGLDISIPGRGGEGNRLSGKVEPPEAAPSDFYVSDLSRGRGGRGLYGDED